MAGSTSIERVVKHLWFEYNKLLTIGYGKIFLYPHDTSFLSHDGEWITANDVVMQTKL